MMLQRQNAVPELIWPRDHPDKVTHLLMIMTTPLSQPCTFPFTLLVSCGRLPDHILVFEHGDRLIRNQRKLVDF